MSMPKSVGQDYLTRRLHLVFAVCAALLAGVVGLGWSLVADMERSASYASAFRHLVDRLNELDRLAHLVSEESDAVTAGNYVRLTNAYAETAALHAALQRADPDGRHVANGDVDAVSGVVNDNAIRKAVATFHLSSGDMPDELGHIWEDDGDASLGLERVISQALIALKPAIATAAPARGAPVQIDSSATHLLNRIADQLPTVSDALDTEMNRRLNKVKLALAAVLLVGGVAGTALWFAFVRPTIRNVAGAQRELTAERDRALQAELAKGEFLAVMSHELRTPMNGVIGFANLLGQSDLNGLQREFVDTIRNSGETLLSLLNDILDFSKIDAGKIELEEARMAPEALVDGILDLLGPNAYAKGLELSSYIDPAMPSHLIGDASRIRQIIFNLAGNAIKFTSAGAVSIEVTRHGDTYEVAVIDTGIGIPADKLATIFDQFTQADSSTSRRYGGTGLGLAISRRLAELMGGTLSAESESGVGSVFRLQLPLHETEPPAESVAEEIDVDLSGRRALVVDDNETNRRILNLMLDGFGARTTAVGDAHAAMSVLLATVRDGDPFEVAVLDHMMPDIDGVELAAMIRAEPRLANLRLVLSSSAHLEAGASENTTDFDERCPKPVRQTKLLASIDRALKATTTARRTTPALAPVRAAAPETPAPTPAANPPTAASGPRILVAEDNATNQRLMGMMLASMGFEHDLVSDGAQALQRASIYPYDLLLLDVSMPEASGLEATRRIRASRGRCADAPIIAITANALKGDREACMEAGMDDYVAKPIDADQLQSKIRQWLASGREKTARTGT